MLWSEKKMAKMAKLLTIFKLYVHIMLCENHYICTLVLYTQQILCQKSWNVEKKIGSYYYWP
jgi:hypothetical protein